ncbi:GumC family protein [Ponticaulis sp.]|uniref:GumC family protein n=1 Tax=Ponticaulis sp. TaxID=2020902 RepID=UPI00260CB0CF|nr:GumC family protein [Ponticaulis sp.]MDF1681795.1 GumC family protein [Ponticaulis sp.]
MAADDGWSNVATSVASSTSASARRSNRPQLDIPEYVLLLWRAKWAIILIALPILALAILFAFMLPVKYAATSRVQVTLGNERVFAPLTTGADAQSANLGQEEITGSEIELIYSPVIFDRVLQEIGMDVIYPDDYEAMMEAPEEDRPLLYERTLLGFQKDFAAGAAPKNPVIRTSYEHEDPIVAARVLNAIVRTYLEYRSELFLDDDDGVLSQQRETLANELSAADAAIERFLVDNRIGDFDTEKESVASLYGAVTDNLFNVQAQRSEVQGRLASLTAQLALTEPTIDLYVETNYQQQLLDLQIERESLLSTYLPGTPQIDAIDRRIQNVQNLISSQGDGVGVIRRGPNEVFQRLDQQRAELEAEASALQTRFEELRRQKNEIEERQLRLTRLEPHYQELLRDHSILENQLRNLTVREGDERLIREVSRANLDNIQILEPARPPAQGKSMRLLVAAAGLLFGGFTGLIVAMIWIFSKNTMPTAACASRTVGLPVLASVRRV